MLEVTTHELMLLIVCFPGVRLYQGVLNRTIPNYAMIAARGFADRDEGINTLDRLGAFDGLNDGLWCQSAMNVSDIGSWKLPNGSAVSEDLYFIPIHMANRPGQVGLLRSDGIYPSPYQGMYTCTIPDENGDNQTLVVWAGANAAYDGTDGYREFQIPMHNLVCHFSLITIKRKSQFHICRTLMHQP